jgi:hypothetical protein
MVFYNLERDELDWRWERSERRQGDVGVEVADTLSEAEWAGVIE